MKRASIILTGISIIIFIIALAKVIFGNVWNIFAWGFGRQAELSFNVVSFVLIAGLIGFGIDYLISKRNFSKNVIVATLLALAQWIFLTKIYYGLGREYFIAYTGIDARLILFAQTALYIVVVVIIYYAALYIFGWKPGVWKAYALISVIGPIVIAGWMWYQPYNFFSHKAYALSFDNGKFQVLKNFKGTAFKENGNPLNIFVRNDDNDYVKPNYWILRDKSEGKKIIDLKSSPGISQRYGRRLVPMTPADVPDVEKYLSVNSKIPYIYKKTNTGNSGGESQTIIENAFFGIVITDGKPSKYYKVTHKHFIFQIGADNFYLRLSNGMTITTSDLRTKNNHLSNVPFQVVPTDSTPVELGIRKI